MANSTMEVIIGNFLNRMAICFALCLVVMYVIARVRPLAKPVEFEKKSDVDLKTSNGAKIAGIIVVIITLALYVLFSPIGLAGK